MTIGQAFEEFIKNLRISNNKQISSRYREITKKLNKTFRNTDSEIDNCLQVGSYGRYTGINGISDLDMLYIMPNNKWSLYRDKPGSLLREVKDALLERYPNTNIKVDRLVVVVKFTNFKFEVQPVFEEVDENGEYIYKYPDTYYETYKISKPRHEQDEMLRFKKEHGDAHRLLSKMIRAWKNNVGVNIGGLLIDTLTHRFLSDNTQYDFVGFSKFDILCRDFFEFLKNEEEHKYYNALGSKQHVKVKGNFQRKAKLAFNQVNKAIEEQNEEKRNKIWRNIFGVKFPKCSEAVVESGQLSNYTYVDREEFIEDKYPVDIKYTLHLDCLISRDGFRKNRLSNILQQQSKITRVNNLDFIFETNVPQPYDVKWKPRNVGVEAQKRNCLRGQIIDSNLKDFGRHESADFCGPHYMECYIIKDGIVVARDRIDVPIE